MSKVPSDGRDTIGVVATDGSALGNPGPGGWGWVTEDGREGSGGVRETTNNRMELRAVLEALRAVDQSRVKVLSDSTYVVKIFNEWLPGWRAKGRMRADHKKRAKNRDLIEAIDAGRQDRDVTFEWVRAHDGHPLNERADELANTQAERVLNASGAELSEVPEDTGFLQGAASDGESLFG